MQSLKTVIVLSSLFGAVELGTRAIVGKGAITIAQYLSAHLVSKFTSLAREASLVRSPTVNDGVRHRKWWGYNDALHQDDHESHFNGFMRTKMRAVTTCHQRCGSNIVCHEACPKPWKSFQEKCAQLRPVWVCQQSCEHSQDVNDCRAKCPLPASRQLARKVNLMKLIGQSCRSLEQITFCHDRCGAGDLSCHHSCPKIKSLWYLGGRKVMPTASAARLRQWWGYHDDHHHDDHRMNFHKAMWKRMMIVKRCHKHCGDDLACHQGCKRPWRSFQAQCTKLEPVWTCHSECRRAHGGKVCHAQCPMPVDKKLAEQVILAKNCQRACWNRKGGAACRRTCPMYKISETCQNLRQIVSCHEKCKPADHVCHSSCPKMRQIWQLGRLRRGRMTSGFVVS